MAAVLTCCAGRTCCSARSLSLGLCLHRSRLEVPLGGRCVGGRRCGVPHHCRSQRSGESPSLLSRLCPYLRSHHPKSSDRHVQNGQGERERICQREPPQQGAGLGVARSRGPKLPDAAHRDTQHNVQKGYDERARASTVYERGSRTAGLKVPVARQWLALGGQSQQHAGQNSNTRAMSNTAR